MKAITKVMMIVAFVVGLLGIPAILAQRDYDAKTVETIGGKVCPSKKRHLQKDKAIGSI